MLNQEPEVRASRLHRQHSVTDTLSCGNRRNSANRFVSAWINNLAGLNLRWSSLAGRSAVFCGFPSLIRCKLSVQAVFFAERRIKDLDNAFASA